MAHQLCVEVSTHSKACPACFRQFWSHNLYCDHLREKVRCRKTIISKRARKGLQNEVHDDPKRNSDSIKYYLDCDKEPGAVSTPVTTSSKRDVKIELKEGSSEEVDQSRPRGSVRKKRPLQPTIEPDLTFEQDLAWKCKWCFQIYPSRDKLATHILIHYFS